jgi:hypothetical protein
MTSITVHLTPDTARKLRQQASSVGMELEGYVAQLAEQHATNGVESRKIATFDEMTAPLAEAVAAAGMRDEELTDFFAGAVKEVRAEKRSKK